MDHTLSVAMIHQRLEEMYGRPTRNPPPLNNKLDPLDELIYITITLLTHEKNVRRAFDGLKTRFPTWHDVLDADIPAIVETLKVAGLANQKAPRIKEILQKIKEYDPEITLSFLEGWTDEDIERFLTSLKGVGKKSARCVMMYSLGREVLPVDTHVYRVSRRLGLLEPEITYDKAMDKMHEIIPPEFRYDLHVNMLIHGREICIAPIPKCPQCRLNNVCKSYRNGVFEPPLPPPGNSRPRH
jgi:endonuclease-3